MENLFGIVTATATPFNKDESVDYVALRELINKYIDAGVHGISIAGSQGEFFAVSREERLRIIEVSVEAIANRVPLYAGTGAVSTRASIEITRDVIAAGADVAMVITPYFVSPSDAELVVHYTAIAKASDAPIILYNNPPRTGVNISAQTFAECAKADNIIGIKDSSGDMTQAAEYLRATERKALLFSGRDTLLTSMVLEGAVGGISPAANVFPRLMVKLYEAARDNDIESAREYGDVLAPLRVAWGLGSFPVVIKEAMAMVGYDAGPTRAPISGLPSDRRAKLKSIVDRITARENALN